MRCPAPRQAERQALAVQLLRDTRLTLVEIGARIGVSSRTVAAWNARAGWPRPPRARSSPSEWDPSRLAAAARLCDAPHNDPVDVAEASGLGRAGLDALLAACGRVARPPKTQGDARLGPLDATAAADAPTLRAHLRAHIARQIAAFDAALTGEGAAVLDSARVLRDLGGLKRLLDEVAAVPGPGAGAAGEGGDGGCGTEPDLPALRAEIARRFAGFVGAGEVA